MKRLTPWATALSVVEGFGGDHGLAVDMRRRGGFAEVGVADGTVLRAWRSASCHSEVIHTRRLLTAWGVLSPPSNIWKPATPGPMIRGRSGSFSPT